MDSNLYRGAMGAQGPAADPILFDRGIPSNMYRQAIVLPHPFTLKPYKYETNEHRFQAKKGRTAEQHDWVAGVSDPFEARNRGRALRLSPNELYEWDHFMALPTMLEVNLVKFTVSHVCNQWLMQTGDAELVEHRPDTIWGDNLDGSGLNLLGRVLMLVRASLR